MTKIVEIPMSRLSGKTTTALAMLRGFLASGMKVKLLLASEREASDLERRNKEFPLNTFLWPVHLEPAFLGRRILDVDVLIVDNAADVDFAIIKDSKNFKGLAEALNFHISTRTLRQAFLFTQSFK